MADEADDSPPRKGRGNAILTYERVDQLTALVTETKVLVNRLVLDQDKAEGEVDKMELRIRAIEQTLAQFVATQTSGRHTALWIWGAAQTAITTVLAILTYVNKH